MSVSRDGKRIRVEREMKLNRIRAPQRENVKMQRRWTKGKC